MTADVNNKIRLLHLNDKKLQIYNEEICKLNGSNNKQFDFVLYQCFPAVVLNQTFQYSEFYNAIKQSN